MERLEIIAFVILIIGAVIAFCAKPFLKLILGADNVKDSHIYIMKILGLLVVIVGAAIVFISGGTFGG